MPKGARDACEASRRAAYTSGQNAGCFLASCGFSIKLNTLPIWKDWDGGLVLVPPYQAAADELEDD